MIHMNLMPEYNKMPDAEKAKWGGIGSYYYYSPGELWIGCAEEDGEILNYSNGDRNNWQCPASRENCLMFAKHVANGLLSLVAEWLEARTADEIRAIACLEVK
jgi:hypothetical protein